jgi:hypothetical protein
MGFGAFPWMSNFISCSNNKMRDHKVKHLENYNLSALLTFGISYGEKFQMIK